MLPHWWWQWVTRLRGVLNHKGETGMLFSWTKSSGAFCLKYPQHQQWKSPACNSSNFFVNGLTFFGLKFSTGGHLHWRLKCHRVGTYPSTASSSIQIKLSSGRTNGGPRSTCGCWDVYWLKQTSAVSLFCRHKNLKTQEPTALVHQQNVSGRETRHPPKWPLSWDNLGKPAPERKKESGF